MSDKDTINVYWAPSYRQTIEEPEDWSMMYSDPQNLYSSLFKLKKLGNTFFCA